MGLDNLPLPKTKPGCEAEATRIKDLLADINMAVEHRYRQEKPYSAEAAEAFWALPDIVTMSTRRKQLEAELDAIEIAPEQTAGCPRVGIDQEATDYAADIYKKELEFYEKQFPTVESYLASVHGKYVGALVKDAEALGCVVGIFAGDLSFRGKVFGYIDWLSADIQDGAYNDMTAEEAVAFGKRLEEDADYFEDNVEGPLNSEDKRNLVTVRKAAAWWRYWGERGHGIHAWY